LYGTCCRQLFHCQCAHVQSRKLSHDLVPESLIRYCSLHQGCHVKTHVFDLEKRFCADRTKQRGGGGTNLSNGSKESRGLGAVGPVLASLKIFAAWQNSGNSFLRTVLCIRPLIMRKFKRVYSAPSWPLRQDSVQLSLRHIDTILNALQLLRCNRFAKPRATLHFFLGPSKSETQQYGYFGRSSHVL
jgi:hypothetical protein